MSSTDPLLIAYLLTGLAVGFGHCIGMCAPLVIALSLGRRGAAPLTSHLLYHGGRVATYTMLGGVMAATGSFTLVVTHITLLQKGAMFLAGALIVIMAMAMGGWFVPLGWLGTDCGPTAAIARLFKRLSRSSSVLASFPIGLAMGLLPCGPVYTALLGVVRGGMEASGMSVGVASGMLRMFFFGVGTLPALLLVSKLADMGWLKFRHKIYKAGAIVMIGVGVYFIISAIRY